MLTEAVGTAGVALKLDVTLPAAGMAGFLDGLDVAADAAATSAGGEPVAPVVVYGHLADGTLHLNLPGLAGSPAVAEAVEEALLRRVVAHGGSIASEHGVGVAKARWLHLQRGDADLAAMRAMKAALDPGGLLNPGVVLP